jgi:hypothetical protein
MLTPNTRISFNTHFLLILALYYGDEGDDYTYGETRVTDTNDYYYDDD